MATGELFAGRYLLGTPVASPAFLEAFEALDQTLNRPVVVSIVTERFSSNREFVSTFASHMRSAMGLVHASIAQTFDVGTDIISGRAYVVTESVAGETLHARLKTRALSVSEVADVLSQVCSALAFAHARGQLHLGLSPKTLYMTPTGRVKLSGFGLFALTSETAPSADLLAATLGGSGYLAPEQILRTGVDARTDVYALGLILSEALCQRPTWDRSLTGEALESRAQASPVLPGTVLPHIPAEIDELISSSTQCDRAARTASPEGFSAKLAQFSHAQTPLVGIEIPVAAVVLPGPQSGNPPAPAPAAAPAAVPPGIDRELASLFPADALSAEPFTPEEFTAGRSRRGFIATLSVAVASVVVIAVAILWVVSTLPANIIPSTSRPVPGVVGYTFEEASKAITDSGLHPVRVDTADASVAVGTVISVSPPVGTKVEIGSNVSVNVSLGSKTVAVPNVVGMTSAAAQALLIKNGFQVGTLTPTNSGTALKDSVLSTKPGVGELVVAGTSINLFVANGKITMPDLVGKSVTQATAILTGPAIGITPRLVGTTSCPATNPATVKTQSVPPGEAPARSPITLSYCTGR